MGYIRSKLGLAVGRGGIFSEYSEHIRNNTGSISKSTSQTGTNSRGDFYGFLTRKMSYNDKQ
jgi:hypothetical protein